MIDHEEIGEQICDILDKVNRKEGLKALSFVLYEYFDLRLLSKLVENDVDPMLDKSMLEEYYYAEGNEEAGHIKLRTVLNAIEEIINHDDYSDENIEFTYFVRPETKEEREENNHDYDDYMEWWTKEENLDIDKLYLQFQNK